MKILDAKVDWFEGYLNEPQLMLLVDNIPDVKEMVYEKIPYMGQYLYVAEKDGFVNFFIWSGKGNDGGYGGAELTVKVKDDKGVHEELVRGPWSSRSGIVNQVWRNQCMEVAITDDQQVWVYGGTLIAGAVTIEKAKEAMKIKPWLRLLKVVDDEGEVRYVPIKITDFPRHGRIIKVELIR